MMWHEARKQEKKIRGLMVDYKRRAERRKDYYEKIKADPTQFLQLHARACKIHLDPAIAMAADSPATMMPWPGGDDIMIDRFDVRAHLDFIPEVKTDNNEPISAEERMLNYERYRILVQNDFLGISEDKFLHQLYMEEQFGNIKPNETSIEGKKKSHLSAAIGFNYDDPTDVTKEGSKVDPAKKSEKLNLAEPKIVVDKDGIVNRIEEVPEKKLDEKSEIGEDEEDSDSDSDVDIDMTLDVNKVNTQQANELNTCAHMYGMNSNDFFSFLTKDVEEAENLKLAREQEEEKALYSGRKSRRERRAFREKRLMGRKISPPSYAKRSPTHDLSEFSALHSKSRSPSPVAAEKITFITSFGGENPSASLTAPTQPMKSSSPSSSRHSYSRKRSRSRSRSKSKHHSSSAQETRKVYIRSSRSLSSSPKRNHPRFPEKSHRRRSRTRSRSRSRSRSPRNISMKYHRESPPSSKTQSSSKNQASSSNLSSHSQRSSKYGGNSTSKSPSTSAATQLPAPPVITRYYGRNRKNSDSSELEVSSDDDSNTPANKSTSNQSVSFGNSSGRSKGLSQSRVDSSGPKLTPQERLKKKMQALLNRQLKADKRAERERVQKQAKEQLERAVEIREISIKRRRRERARRHHEYYDSDTRHSDSSESSSASRSRSRSPDRSKYIRSHNNSDEEEEEISSKRDRTDRPSGRDSDVHRSNEKYSRDRYQAEDRYHDRYSDRDLRFSDRDNRNTSDRFDRGRHHGEGYNYDQGSRYNNERSSYYDDRSSRYNRDDRRSRNSEDESSSRRPLVNY